MVTMPIGTYFLTLNSLYRGEQINRTFSAPNADITQGNSTFAGATAAIIANVVLIAYVIVAMKEDQSERLAAEQKEKKAM